MVDFYSEQEAERVKQHNRLMTTINIAEVAAGAGTSTPFTIDNALSPRDFPSDKVNGSQLPFTSILVVLLPLKNFQF